MNAHTGLEFMAIRDQAIAHCGAAGAQLRSLERTVNKGIVLATSEGLPGVLDVLLTFKSMIAAAHTFGAEQVAPAIAAAMGDSDVTPFSGGTGTGKDNDAL